jgi:hypothetical protein
MAIIYTFKGNFESDDLASWAQALQDELNPNWFQRAGSTAWAPPLNEDGTPPVTKPVRAVFGSPIQGPSISVFDGEPAMFDNVVMHMHWAVQLAKISGRVVTFLKADGRLRVTVSQNTELESLLRELREKMAMPASQFQTVENIGPAEK